MVSSCAAINCTSRRVKGFKQKFHRIPTDPNVRQLWLNALRRVNFVPSKTTVICERHFTPQDYEINPHGNNVLKKGSVPTVFDFSARLIKVVKKRTPLKIAKFHLAKRKTETKIQPKQRENTEYSPDLISENISEAIPKARPTKSKNIPRRQRQRKVPVCRKAPVCRKMPVCRKEPVFFGDFKESDLNHPARRKRFWNVANQIVSKLQKINKYYRYKDRRQKLKIKSLLDEMTKDTKISSEEIIVVEII